MENLDPIEIAFLVNESEVRKSTKKVRDEIKGIAVEAENVSARVDKQINNAFKGQATQINKGTAALANQKKQYDTLGYSMAQITRELPAFTFSAQTGLIAISNNIPILADEIGRLRVKNEALIAAGKKGTPVFRQVVKSFLSWNTVLSVGITLMTVFGPQIFAFFQELFKGTKIIDENKESIEALNKAYESNSYQKAVKSVVTVRAAFAGAGTDIDKKRAALTLYNKELGKVLGTANNYNAAEQLFRDKSDAYVKALLFRAAAAEAVNEASKELIRLTKEEDEIVEKIEAKRAATPYQGRTFKNVTKGLFDDKTALEKEAKDIETTYNRIINKLNGKADELSKSFNLSFEDNKNSKELGQQKKLLQQLAALDLEYARKKLSSDAQEVSALREKFNKIRKLVTDFNNDPKTKVGSKIDLTAFNQLENNAVKDLDYKHQTAALKTELDSRKALFKDFEEYKKEFGIAKAKEQFAALLKEYDNYGAVLAAKFEENKEAQTNYINSDNTPQSKRIAFLVAEAEAYKKTQEQSYSELLAELQTYEEKRTRLLTDYQENRKKLIARGDISAAEELKKRVDEEVADLDESYAKSTDEYKALIAGVSNLSDTAARAVIVNARKMVQALLAAGTISEETAREIISKIDALEAEVDGRTSKSLEGIANKINQIAGAFINLGQSLEAYNADLADTITTIGELGQVAGDAAGSLAAFAVGDIVGGISGAINAIAGLFSIGARSRESARQAQAEVVRLQQEIEAGERRLNELLRKRNLEKAKEVELTLKGLAAQRKALALAKEQLALEEKTLFQQLQNEQYIASSKTKKYGGFLGIGRKTKVVNEYADLLGLTFEEIEALYEKGQLTERASELFEQLRKLREEGKDINKLLSDLEQQAQEIFTGTTANAIADSIIEGLKSGKDSFEDFAGDIEKLLQNSILNAIKYNVLEKPIQDLYEKFAQFAESEGELTEQEANAIRAQYQAQVQKALDQYEQLSGLLDEDLLNGDQAATGLQGAIRRELTEETASELTGLFRGQFDITKRHYDIAQRHYETEQKHLESTLDIMGISAAIESNTANTVTELKLAVTELKLLNKNKKSQSGRDLGLGG